MSNLDPSLYQQVIVTSSKKTIPESRTYRGFSTVATVNQGFTLYDFELIKQDLINHFHIRQGEKISDPTFGTILWDMLYEQFTPEIEQAIIDDVTRIVNYDQRLMVDRVVVESFEQGIIVECTVTFKPYNITENLKFNFDQANGLVFNG